MTSFKFALEIRSRPVGSNALIVVGLKISNVYIKIGEPKWASIQKEANKKSDSKRWTQTQTTMK